MTRLVLVVTHILLAMTLLFGGSQVVLCGQEETPPPADATYEFFSGVVHELPEGKITVVRAILGKPAETRSFLITAETKVEGKLHQKARVTVGFKPVDGNDVAVRIIVRSENAKKP